MLPIKSKFNTHRLVAIDIKTGVTRWTFNQDQLNFKMKSSISCSGDSCVVSGIYKSHMGGEQYVLLNIENQSGDIQWKSFFSNKISRPIITPFSMYMLDTQKRELVYMDTLTGDLIPQVSFQALDSFMVYKNSLYIVFVEDNKIKIQSYS